MTADTIFQEIEKRLDFLDKKKEKIYWEILIARSYGDDKKENKLLDSRRKIETEHEKLNDMRRAYKGRF